MNLNSEYRGASFGFVRANVYENGAVELQSSYSMDGNRNPLPDVRLRMDSRDFGSLVKFVNQDVPAPSPIEGIPLPEGWRIHVNQDAMRRFGHKNFQLATHGRQVTLSPDGILGFHLPGGESVDARLSDNDLARLAVYALDQLNRRSPNLAFGFECGRHFHQYVS